MEDYSVIIVTYKRIESLTQVLTQLNHLNNVFVVINGDHNPSYGPTKKEFPQVNFLEGSFKTPGEARNFALREIRTPWVLFLDDDVLLPENYLSLSDEIRASLEPEIVCFGGPDQPIENSNLFQQALSKTLSSPMATAHTRLRHSRGKKTIINGKESNLILCHLWMRTDFLKKNDLKFSPHLFRNEENLLISQITSLGGKGQYFSGLYVHHHRKSRLDHLTRAVFSSGKNRVKSFILDRSLFHPLYLVPAFWVLYLAFLGFDLPLKGKFIPLQIYITLSVFLSIKVCGERAKLFPLVLFYQIWMNFFYGLGILWGLFLSPLYRLRL